MQLWVLSLTASISHEPLPVSVTSSTLLPASSAALPASQEDEVG